MTKFQLFERKVRAYNRNITTLAQQYQNNVFQHNMFVSLGVTHQSIDVQVNVN